ncbi:MAG: hypothetical protein HYY49_12835 [Ignavibacteriales bacterium]|nr:hypothetical protein [Ignavibacteriales bacterium]
MGSPPGADPPLAESPALGTPSVVHFPDIFKTDLATKTMPFGHERNISGFDVETVASKGNFYNFPKQSVV